MTSIATSTNNTDSSTKAYMASHTASRKKARDIVTEIRAPEVVLCVCVCMCVCWDCTERGRDGFVERTFFERVQRTRSEWSGRPIGACHVVASHRSTGANRNAPRGRFGVVAATSSPNARLSVLRPV